jgi:hypothetical protein
MPGGRYEPIGNDFRRELRVLEGAQHVPGLPGS